MYSLLVDEPGYAATLKHELRKYVCGGPVQRNVGQGGVCPSRHTRLSVGNPVPRLRQKDQRTPGLSHEQVRGRQTHQLVRKHTVPRHWEVPYHTFPPSQNRCFPVWIGGVSFPVHPIWLKFWGPKYLHMVENFCKRILLSHFAIGDLVKIQETLIRQNTRAFVDKFQRIELLWQMCQMCTRKISAKPA